MATGPDLDGQRPRGTLGRCAAPHTSQKVRCARLAGLGIKAPTQTEVDAGKWVKVRYGYNQVTGERTFTWCEPGKPAPGTTWGKFYTVHLKDASPEDRATIEVHLGLSFTFDDNGGVRWAPAPKLSAPADTVWTFPPTNRWRPSATCRAMEPVDACQ